MSVNWDDKTEEWRDLPGFLGYMVSSLGRVRSPRRILKPWTSNSVGHVKVTLPGNRRMWVHRAVALAFHGPCPPGLEVRHLDGVATNNRPSNLKYGTHSENMLDRTRHGRASAPPRPTYKMHCPQGHPYDFENTRIAANGKKDCRICRAARKAAYVKRQKGITVACACGSVVSKLNYYKHRQECPEGAK